MNRRDLAGAVAGAGLLAIAGACMAAPEAPEAFPHPTGGLGDADARLVQYGREATPLIAQYKRHSARFFALPDGDREIDLVASAMDLIGARLDRIIVDVTALRATSQPARAAKALILDYALDAYWGEQGAELWEGLDPHTLLAWSLAYDVMREKGA